MSNEAEGSGAMFVFCGMWGLICLLGYAVYTDEYEVFIKNECTEYSQYTGKCIKNTSQYVCKVDNGDMIVAYCGDDVDKCIAICKEYNNE